MSRPPLAALVVPAAIAACWLMMGLAYFLSPAAWPLVMVAAWSLLGALVVVTISPQWQLFGPALVRVDDRPGVVALTFDDGPHPVHTRAILDHLDAAGARATFFLIGQEVERRPEVAREIVRRGHQVAQHGHDHRWQRIFHPAWLADDFERAVLRIQAATGRVPRFFRPPVGVTTPEVLDACLPAFRFAAWSLRPFDGRIPDPDLVRERVRSKIRAGDIVLLHDAARHARFEPPAVRALPGILADLKERGLRSVTLAELTGEPAYIEELPVPRPPRRRVSSIPLWVACTLVMAVICSSACAFGAEPDAPLPAGLVEAAAKLTEATTVQAHFEQTKTSILFTEPVVQTGRLLLRRSDGRLLWIYDDGPAVLMADGRFLPAGPEAVVDEEDGGGFGIPGGSDLISLFEGMFTLNIEVLERFFVGKDLGEGRFELRPKGDAGAALFSAVVLTVGGEPLAVRAVEMHESTGDLTTLLFTEVLIGGEIAADRFLTPAERAASTPPTSP
jgi:peptidoglycan-N-acetylglucosamine deacetylase